MRIPRISLGNLMFTVVFAGVIFAEIRAFLAFLDGPISNVNAIYFVAPLLTVGNLLAFLMALRVPEVWRTGRLRMRPFWWGFQAVSWATFAGFGLICLIGADTLIGDYLMPPGSAIDLALRFVDSLLPRIEGMEDLFEVCLMAILFGLPILALGLLGGLVTWALGIELDVRFRRRRRPARGAVVESAPRESLAP